MNFNASRNVTGPAGGMRKPKRVSDVNSMGAPAPNAGMSPMPGFGPAPASGFYQPPNTSAHMYQEGFHLESHQTPISSTPIASPGYGFNVGAAGMAYPASPITMLNQPVVQEAALQYGSTLAAQGEQAVRREIDKFVSSSRLRYYFAVDTRYVLKKLLLLFFPFTHKDWTAKYEHDAPMQPRYDVNSVDLYIPYMGYVTYVLLAGFMLGLQNQFSPEQIGIQASSALAYIIFEVVLYLLTLYVTNTNTSLKTLDLLAYSGYKYIAMIASLLGGLVFGRTGYYVLLAYNSLMLAYFLVNSLRVQILSKSHAPQSYYGQPQTYGQQDYAHVGKTNAGSKRRLYFLLFVAVIQPVLCWWLTYRLVPSEVVKNVLPTR